MALSAECPDCGVFNDLTEEKCWRCGRPISEQEKRQSRERHRAAEAEQARFNSMSQREQDIAIYKQFLASAGAEIIPDDVLDRMADSVTLTTGFDLARYEIMAEAGIVTAEVVYGVNVFRDLLSGITDLVGGQSGALQKVLKDAKNTVLQELKKEALRLGCQAVIAVDLDYQEISGGGKSGMIMLAASGTAVKTRKRSVKPA